MGRLKPIGSEKLQGQEKLNRIIEISRYKENIPTPVNEDKSREYSIVMSNGVEYVIDKEKNGYVLKKRIDESTFDYLESMKNRSYYRSYSQAFKRLNLVAKEINTQTGNEEGISLFSEQKYVLKTPKPETPPAPAPSPEPSPAPDSSAEPMDSAPEDMAPPSDDMPDMGPEGGEEMPDMGPEGGEEMGKDDEGSSLKSVQKLTGKLAQKIRTLDDEEISSKDIKYVINSILSAVDLEKLEDEDKDEILSRFDEDEMGGEEGSPEAPDMGPEGDEEMPDEPEGMEEPLEGEFGEGMDNFNKKVSSAFAGNLKFEDDSSEEESFYSNIFDGVFSESKVEKVLSKYFNLSEMEKKQLQKKKIQESHKRKMNLKLNLKEANRLSETEKQAKIAEDILKKYTEAKVLGLTNKKNLVIEHKGSQIKITTKGDIL